MNAKRWLAVLCLLLAAAALCYPLLTNVVQAAFGSGQEEIPVPLSPEEQLNRLQADGGKYDSYLLGGPAAAAVPLQDLNRYLDASFCGLTWFEGALSEYQQVIARLMSWGNVKNLVLVLDPAVAKEPDSAALSDLEQTMAILAEIHAQCRTVNANLFVVWQPLSPVQMNRYEWADLERLQSSCAFVTDCWSFLEYGSVQCSEEYITEDGCYTELVGKMMLARIFSDPTVKVPADFGRLLTVRQPELPLEEEAEPSNVARVPIFLYHGFVETPEQVTDTAVVSAAAFESQLQTLQEAGYETVTLADLVAFVYEEQSLPEKPVVLIADDGYLNNLTIAAPLLKEYGARMSVAVIGCSVGKDTYKETGLAINPHFSLEQVKPWVESGIIEIVSHTFDMHQVKGMEPGVWRQGMYPLCGETEETYAQAIREDLNRSKQQLEGGLGVEVNALAYPYGYYTECSEQTVQEMGFRVTMTTIPGSNRLVRGMPQSLYLMSRWWVTEDLTGEALLEVLQSK